MRLDSQGATSYYADIQKLNDPVVPRPIGAAVCLSDHHAVLVLVVADNDACHATKVEPLHPIRDFEILTGAGRDPSLIIR